MAARLMRTNVRTYAFEGGTDPSAARNAFEKENPGALVQTFGHGSDSNGFFVQMIAAQTFRAALTGSMLAKKPEIDFLLRIAGTSQISDAIARVGAKRGEPFLLVVATTGTGKARIPGLRCRPLPKRTLTETELGRVEKAALLSARRA
jgi:hypothetical protein